MPERVAAGDDEKARRDAPTACTGEMTCPCVGCVEERAKLVKKGVRPRRIIGLRKGVK